MNYELKDKITSTNEILNELEIKGWQEIEHLQAQIANLAEGAANDRLRQLLKNLLTSYYIFTGGIETLVDKTTNNTVIKQEFQADEQITDIEQELIEYTPEISNDIDSPVAKDEEIDYEVGEPFEYFVDFDDPIGAPITDEDLYNN